MSWSNLGMPTISEVSMDSRMADMMKEISSPVILNGEYEDEDHEENGVSGGNGQIQMVGETDEGDVSDAFKRIEGSKLEPLMLSILEQREKLQDQLQKMHFRVDETEKKLAEVERERDSLKIQLDLQTQHQPAELSAVTRELAQCREMLMEKDEEIVELKAERNNTRLLLEHLECLVSKHEKALRMTVVKRHSQATRESVSSEVDVLKALRSLFEHHKALDEKVRERLNVAVKRVQSLETELNAKTEENIALKSRLAATLAEAVTAAVSAEQQQKHLQQGEGEEIKENGEESPEKSLFFSQGASLPLAQLQEQLERQAQELAMNVKQIQEMAFRNNELETQLSGAEKEAQMARERCKTIELNMAELQNSKGDYESRLSSLESRLLAAQEQALGAQQQHDKLQCELANKEAARRINEEKMLALQERLELAEQQLEQSLKQRPSTEALIQQLTLKQNTAEERVQHLDQLLKERNSELERAIQREKMNEMANQRLSSTVDKLLLESNDRLQIHLKERMQAQLEKNRLMQSLEQSRKMFEQLERAKERTLSENDTLRKELEILQNQLYSTRTAQFYSRFGDSIAYPTINGSVQPAAVNINGVEPPPSQHPTIIRRQQRGRVNALQSNPNAMQTLNEQDWERMQQEAVLQNIHQAFSTSTTSRMVDGGGVEVENNVSNDAVQTARDAARDPLSPIAAGANPQTLAFILQEKIDAINNEIRQIQEEKQITEQAFQQQQQQSLGGVLTGRKPYEGGPIPASAGVFPSEEALRGSPTDGRPPPSSQRFSPRGSTTNIYAQPIPQQYGMVLPPEMMIDPIELEYQMMPRNIGRGPPIPGPVNYGVPPGGGHPMMPLPPQYLMQQQQLPNGQFPPQPLSNHHYQNSFDSYYPADGVPLPQPFPTSLDNIQRAPSEASSLSDVIGPLVDTQKGTPTLKRRSTSTSSGFKSLGRWFSGSGSKKTRAAMPRKSPINQPLGGDLFESAYSDSEIVNNNGGETQPTKGGARLGASDFNMTATTAAAAQDSLLPATPQMLDTIDFDKRKKKKHHLLEEAIKARTPFALWNGPTVVAWLELWVQMPNWYVEACRANVKSGAIMCSLTDQDIQREIGVNNSLHRLKLRLAIQEMVQLTSPSSPRHTLAHQYYRGQASLTHEWIGNDWLPSLGLARYRSEFMENLVDGRMLEHLTKRDLSKSLKLTDNFHRTSLQYGIMLLKQINYDRRTLEARRQASENQNRDLLVWSNQRVAQWVEEIGLGAFAKHLNDSGVHGALIVMDQTFDYNALATLLQLPGGQHDSSRRALEDAFVRLVGDARHQLQHEQQSGGVQNPQQSMGHIGEGGGRNNPAISNTVSTK